MSDALDITQSKLATYLKCQRKYRYDYERDVTVQEETRALEFGRALHETIRDVCDRVRDGETYSDDAIRDLAEEAFQRQWQAEVDPDSYRTEAHYEDDRRVANEAIAHFFDEGDGVDHARRSVAAEIRIEFERDGVTYSGYVDNVLTTEDGLELVDYKKSAIDPPVSSRKNYVKLQYEGEYRPQRVKNAIQALLYMEGIKETEYYDPDDMITFTYQPLADAAVDRKQSQLAVEFDNRQRSVAEDVREHSHMVWAIIEDAVDGIQAGAFEPTPFEEIEEDECDRCSFQSMCSTYLEKKEFKL